MKPQWKQELLWVKRDDQGTIIALDDKPPKTEDFVPTVPRNAKSRPASRLHVNQKTSD
jgi:hypothetical protein